MPDADDRTDGRTFEDLRWGPRRRLEFIDFRLMWNGRINRSDIVAHFNISAQQASADLAAYERLAPDNLRYDRVQRAFVRASSYRPFLVSGLSDRYLLQLQAVHGDLLPIADTWFDDVPPMDVAALGRRRVDDAVLTAVLDAIRDGRSLRVEYSTMSGKPATQRMLAPHALGQGSDRWHARCFDFGTASFRDFNLNRMTALGGVGGDGVDAALDVEWHTPVTLRLCANRLYSDDKRRAIAEEFGFDGPEKHLPTRVALVFYLMQDLFLDPEFDVLPAQRRQLELVNPEEVERARSDAQRDARDRIASAGLSPRDPGAW